MKVGAHIKRDGSLHFAVEKAVELGCRSLQVVTDTPRSWDPPPLREEERERFSVALGHAEMSPGDVLVHAPYVINLCEPKSGGTPERAIARTAVELQRVGDLGLRQLIVHPGVRRPDRSEAQAIVEMARNIDRALEAAEDAQGVVILLENLAGVGYQLGARFEHLRDIIGSSRYPERFALCVDTCHMFAAGLDVRSELMAEMTFRALDRIIGLEHIAAFHLNDSAEPFDSRRDRHANIGEGLIGDDVFRWLLRHERFENTPSVIETPTDDHGHARDLDTLRDLAERDPEPFDPGDFGPPPGSGGIILL